MQQLKSNSGQFSSHHHKTGGAGGSGSVDDYTKFEIAGGRLPLKVCTASEGGVGSSTPTATQDRNDDSEMTPGLRQKIAQADGTSDLKGQIENIINKSDDNPGFSGMVGGNAVVPTAAPRRKVDAEEDVTNYEDIVGEKIQ